MNYFNKILTVFGLAVVGLLAVVLFRNSTLTDESKDEEDPESRIRLLTLAGDVYSFNDRTDYEMGKAYFDLGLRSLSQGRESTGYFQAAIRSLRRSLELNPFSPFSHFHLAQSLFYAGAASSEEFKLSAELAGRNSQIFFEVGKIFLSRWKDLGDREKDFTTGILRTVLAQWDQEKLQALLSTWDLNVRDYDVVDRLLPDEPGVYRAYARFLGERALSLERRQQAIAKAEYLEFGKAKAEYDAGENALFYYRAADSAGHFQTCLEWLGNIRFTQDITGQRLIDPDDYMNLKKSVHLNLAKARIEQGSSLKDVETDLESYLEIENRSAAVGELESYLLEKGLAFKNPEKHIDDLETLEFQLRLYFHQSRYGEIIRIGRIFVQNVIVVPTEKRDAYLRILCLLGDAHQKVDFLYDAGDFYQKALDIDPGNLEVLIKIRQNYGRLNNDQMAKEIQDRILHIVSPKSVSTGVSVIPKGANFEQFLIFEGHDVALDLRFKEAPTDPFPLIVVVFNNRVIWDGYLRGQILSLSLKTRVGRNRMNIVAVNRPVELVGVDIR